MYSFYKKKAVAGAILNLFCNNQVGVGSIDIIDVNSRCGLRKGYTDNKEMFE